MAKDFFNENNIAYTDHDVAADLEQRQIMMDKTGQLGVPVIIVTPEGSNEEVIIGFDEDRLRQLLINK